MPSLEQLRNFKASFGNIAGEAATLSQLDLPPEDLPLPNSEPAAPPPFVETPSPRTTPPATAADDAVPPRPGAQSPVERSGAPGPSPSAELEDLGLGFGFADLLGGGPANLAPPPATEAIIEEALAQPAAETSGGEAPVPDAPADRQDIPDIDFSDLFDDIAGEGSAAEDTGLGDEDFDAAFGDFDNAGVDGAEPGLSPGDALEPDTGIDIGDFPDFGEDLAAAGDGTGGAEETAASPEPVDDASLPDFSDIDLDAGGFPDFGDDLASAGDGTGGAELEVPTEAGDSGGMDFDADFPGMIDIPPPPRRRRGPL
jgi:hypothetical protein